MHLLLITSKVGDNNIYGARPIKRKIQTQIENELSKLIISDNIIKEGVTVSFTDGDWYQRSIKSKYNQIHLFDFVM